MNLLYVIKVTFPLNKGLRRLINAPKVDVLALACHSNCLSVLPLYVETLEVRVNRFVVEAGDISWNRCGAIPDLDLTHKATSSHQVVCLLAEFALHKRVCEGSNPIDVDGTITVYLPDTGYHVRGTRHQLVTSLVPVDRAHLRLHFLLLLVIGLDVRDLFGLQISAILISQVPQVCDEAASCRD